ncbi:hypothetical protein [Aquihabitans sp. McL0605]|uniref:hypothetical protein n=1 Tax=Aquihabitans sp. McL0605 TaxID=3415671 RepID=UPI003CE96666
MERTRRGGAAGLLLVGVLVLGACGTSGGSEGATIAAGDGSPSTTSSTASSTGSSTTSSVTPGTDGEPGAVDKCAAIGTVLLIPARLESESDSLPSVKEQVAALHTIAAMVPDSEREAWTKVVDIADRNGSDPTSVTEAEAKAAVATLDGSVAWALATCPDLPPSWRCQVHGSFHVVGQGIDPDGSTDDPAGHASPEAALAQLASDDGDLAADAAIELDRSDGAVLYGWVDDDGLVTRAVEVDRTDGAWAIGTDSSCDSTSFGGGAPIGGGTTTTPGG